MRDWPTIPHGARTNHYVSPYIHPSVRYTACVLDAVVTTNYLASISFYWKQREEIIKSLKCEGFAKAQKSKVGKIEIS